MIFSNTPHRSDRAVHLMVLVPVMVLLASSSTSSGVFAQSDALPTPEPTATIEPTPAPTATLEPTATIEPTPEPTATLEPTPEPTATLEPTPEPTATLEPTIPEPTPEPSSTPEPTATAEPTPEPTPVPSTREACGAPVALAPSVSAQAIDFGTLVWDGSGYPTVQRQLTISIQGPDENCSAEAGDWGLQISTSGMADPGGATIPASTIVYVGPSGTVPAGVTPVSGRWPLSSTGTMIASGSSSVAAGGTWPITLEFTPPSDTPPGVYTATIRFDVVSAGS